jgi:hypothetical protein
MIEIEKGRELIRVQWRDFHGKTCLDARVFYEDDEGAWKPTKKGLCINPETARRVAEAILGELAEKDA